MSIDPQRLALRLSVLALIVIIFSFFFVGTEIMELYYRVKVK